MAAILIRDPNPDSPVKLVRTSGSQAYTQGDIVIYDRTSDAVDVLPATATTTTEPTSLYGVCQQTIAATATSMLVQVFRPGQEWLVDSSNNTSLNQNGLRFILKTVNSIDNSSATDTATAASVFVQTGIQGAATAKKVIGTFLVSPGITGNV